MLAGAGSFDDAHVLPGSEDFVAIDDDAITRVHCAAHYLHFTADRPANFDDHRYRAQHTVFLADYPYRLRAVWFSYDCVTR